MKLRTEYHTPAGQFPQLDPRRPLLLLGSCFADNMGDRLTRAGWTAAVNPCGVLYNPASIAAAISHALDPHYTARLQRHPQSGVHFSFDFSTKYAHANQEVARLTITDALTALRSAIYSAQALFVTFGTAWVFELAQSGEVVANCHKLHPDTFRRRQLSISECVAMWDKTISSLRKLNPSLEVVFTVSPVRHLADGFAGNARSKARLLLLCEELAARPACHYFPAFEILNDDLRDYRFYAEDMAHPSSTAADYIYEKFTDAFVAPADIDYLAQKAKKIRRDNHRPIIGK